MSIEITARTRGERDYRDALVRLSPSENPEILRKAYTEELGPRLVEGIQSFMVGPRPQRVDRVTGELHDSVTFKVRGARLEAGVPISHFWWDLHEFGSRGGRKQKRRKTLTRGYPARPAVKPGLDEALESGDLAAGLRRVWEEEALP